MKPKTRRSKFERFAFLPAEIRNLIWEFACLSPPRVHFLALPKSLAFPHVGFANDIADLDKHNSAHRDTMRAMLSYSDRIQSKMFWSVPGCVRYAYMLRSRRVIHLVCPESKAVVNRGIGLDDGRVYLKGGSLTPASQKNDIFCFQSPLKDCSSRHEHMSTAKLFFVRPQIRPAQIAIELMYGDESDSVSNFAMMNNGDLELRLPRWFTKSIEWAHDAKEESSTGVQVLVKPPQSSLGIDLQDLHTVFILSYGITFLNPHSSGKDKHLLENSYTKLVEGFESRFYILDPDSSEVLQHWSIPSYVWAARAKIDRLFNQSASWKIQVKIMAAIGKTSSKYDTSLVKVPTVEIERELFAGAK